MLGMARAVCSGAHAHAPGPTFASVRLLSSSERGERVLGKRLANMDEPLAEYEWKGFTICFAFTWSGVACGSYAPTPGVIDLRMCPASGRADSKDDRTCTLPLMGRPHEYMC